MADDMERRGFLGMIGLGFLGAQTVTGGASEPAEEPEPVVMRKAARGEVRGDITREFSINGGPWIRWDGPTRHGDGCLYVTTPPGLTFPIGSVIELRTVLHG